MLQKGRRHESTKSSCQWFLPDPSICSETANIILPAVRLNIFRGFHYLKAMIIRLWKPIGHCLTRKSGPFISGSRFRRSVPHRRSASITDGSIWLPTTIPIRKIFMSIQTISTANGRIPFLWIRAVLIRLCILKETKFILSAMERMNQMEEAVAWCEIDHNARETSDSRPIWKEAAAVILNHRICIILGTGIISWLQKVVRNMAIW